MPEYSKHIVNVILVFCVIFILTTMKAESPFSIKTGFLNIYIYDGALPQRAALVQRARHLPVPLQRKK